MDIRSGYVSCPDMEILVLITLHLQDTYRAAWAWLIFFAPERVPDMITSMLQDYKEV